MLKMPKGGTLAGRGKRQNKETKANESNSQGFTEFSMNFLQGVRKVWEMTFVNLAHL